MLIHTFQWTNKIKDKANICPEIASFLRIHTMFERMLLHPPPRLTPEEGGKNKKKHPMWRIKTEMRESEKEKSLKQTSAWWEGVQRNRNYTVRWNQRLKRYRHQAIREDLLNERLEGFRWNSCWLLSQVSSSIRLLTHWKLVGSYKVANLHHDRWV